MEWWVIGATANTVILVAYSGIALSIFRGLYKSGQWRSNPLMLATGSIFVTCAIHHGSHPVHQILPYIGLEEHTGIHMREAFNDWHVSSWDIITAAVGVWYFSLRHRFPFLARGSALFEDMKQRQRQALEIHDNIVQGLATAKLSFEMGRHDEGLRSVEKTLAASRAIITDLLGAEASGNLLSPGELRRADRATSS